MAHPHSKGKVGVTSKPPENQNVHDKLKQRTKESIIGKELLREPKESNTDPFEKKHELVETRPKEMSQPEEERKGSPGQTSAAVMTHK